jgi:hypothetical protein
MQTSAKAIAYSRHARTGHRQNRVGAPSVLIRRRRIPGPPTRFASGWIRESARAFGAPRRGRRALRASAHRTLGVDPNAPTARRVAAGGLFARALIAATGGLTRKSPAILIAAAGRDRASVSRSERAPGRRGDLDSDGGLSPRIDIKIPDEHRLRTRQGRRAAQTPHPHLPRTRTYPAPGRPPARRQQGLIARSSRW